MQTTSWLLIAGAGLLAACTGAPPPQAASAPPTGHAAADGNAPGHEGEHGDGHGNGSGHGHGSGHGSGHGHGHGNGPGPGHSCGGADHRFEDPERWSKVFDDPARDAWQKPTEVVRELGLKPTDVVADLGAGTGYFVPHLSRALPKGRVIAIDLEPKMVKYTLERAKKLGLNNVEGVVATAQDPKLPPGVTQVLVVDTYHHITERTAYFRRVRDRIGAKGRVVIVDFRMGKLPVGPPDSHKLPPETAQKEMRAAGFAQCASFDELPYQYMLSFAEQC